MVTRARYYRGVTDAAREIWNEVRASSNRDEIIDQSVAEYADNAVTYTNDALNIVVESDNWTQIYEEVGMQTECWGIDEGASGVITKMAYWAYRADLLQTIDYLKEQEAETNA